MFILYKYSIARKAEVGIFLLGQACLVRRAFRKAAKKIQLQISDASGTGHDAGSMMSAAAAMISDMVKNVCETLDVLQEVRYSGWDYKGIIQQQMKNL